MYCAFIYSNGTKKRKLSCMQVLNQTWTLDESSNGKSKLPTGIYAKIIHNWT